MGAGRYDGVAASIKNVPPISISAAPGVDGPDHWFACRARTPEPHVTRKDFVSSVNVPLGGKGPIHLGLFMASRLAVYQVLPYLDSPYYCQHPPCSYFFLYPPSPLLPLVDLLPFFSSLFSILVWNCGGRSSYHLIRLNFYFRSFIYFLFIHLLHRKIYTMNTLF